MPEPFLSKDEQDVQDSINGDLAATRFCEQSKGFNAPRNQIRIAFDGDAVLFYPESERCYKEHGLEAFVKREHRLRHRAMAEGPFSKLLITLAKTQSHFPQGECPI